MTPSTAFDLRNPPEGQGPLIKLVTLILHECIAKGADSARFGRIEGDKVFLEVRQDGTWSDMMAFPDSVYEGLAGRLRNMAGIAGASSADQRGSIRVLWDGEERRVGLAARRSSAGRDELELTFGEGVSPAA